MEAANENIILDLARFKSSKSTNFTGRPQGTAARKDLALSRLDMESNVKVTLKIPEGTTSFNPSFYLGLLYDSFKKLGIEGFKKKYVFHISSENVETKRVLEKNLEDGMRNAVNALDNKNILKEFISSGVK